MLFQWAFAPTSVSFWSFLRAADAGDAAPGVHCGTKSFLPPPWVFTPIHIGDGGRGLATKVSNAPFLLSFFFFFLGKMQSETFCLKLALQKVADAVGCNTRA